MSGTLSTGVQGVRTSHHLPHVSETSPETVSSEHTLTFLKNFEVVYCAVKHISEMAFPFWV